MVLTACNPNLEKAWALGIHPLKPSLSELKRLALEFVKEFVTRVTGVALGYVPGICCNWLTHQIKAVLKDLYMIIKENCSTQSANVAGQRWHTPYGFGRQRQGGP